AGFFDTSQQSMVIQGEGRVHSLADLENAVVEVKNSVPVRIKDVARVQLGAEYKVGDSSTFGKPSVFLMVNKQPWANTLTATRAAEAALEEVKQALPEDVIPTPPSFVRRVLLNAR